MTRSIAYMVGAVALLAGMDGLAKWLVTNGVPVVQILAIRSVIIVGLMLIIFSWRQKAAELRPRRARLHAYRGLIGFISPLSFFLGLSYIPLTDAVVIFFSSIFTVTLMSVIFLKERVGIHRWTCVFVGFAGVLIVATPQGGGETVGYLLVLLGSFCYSILFVSGRYLSATDTVPSLVFSFNLIVGVCSLLLLPWLWAPLSWMQFVQIGALALLAASGHYLITLAFSSSEASLIAPFEYTALVWAVLLDWFVWQSSPTLNTAVGACIIIASGVYIAFRENRQKKAAILVSPSSSPK